jgi:hypothetical protein
MPNQQQVLKCSGIMLRSREYQIVKKARVVLRPPPRPPALVAKFSYSIKVTIMSSIE